MSIRRLSARAAGLLAIACSAITCTDAPTGPGGPLQTAPSRLALSPAFSPAASRAFRTLENAGIDAWEVHVHVIGGIAPVDTTVALRPGQDSLQLDLQLPVKGLEQTFSALVELQSAGTVLFSRTQDVKVRAASLPALGPAMIVLEYVGPGVAARTVTVSAPDTAIAPDASLALSAFASDSAGVALSSVIVNWTSSDTTLARVAATGYASATLTSAGRIGSALITATTPTGVVGVLRVTTLSHGAAARVQWVQAPPQTITAATPLPAVAAQLTDAGGRAAGTAGVMVRLRATSDSDSFADSLYRDSSLTDAAGIARFALPAYMGPTGHVTLAVSTPGLDPATQRITVLAGPAARLTLLSVLPASVASGVAFSPAVEVQVADAAGNPVPSSTTVTVSTTGGATLAGASSVQTSAEGRASFTGLSVRAPGGSYSLQFAAPSLAPVATPSIAVTGGRASALVKVAGAQQTAEVGTNVATDPAVRVVDVNGTGVPGVRVVFAARNGSAVGGAAVDTVLSDSTGLASKRWAMGRVSTTDTLVVTSDSLVGSPMVLTALALAGDAARLDVVPSTTTPGARQTVEVSAQLRDQFSNAVRTAGQTISWSDSPAVGSFSVRATVTDSLGAAHVVYTPTPSAGVSVTIAATGASVTGNSPAVVTTVGLATQLTLLSVADSVISVGVASTPVQVQLADVNGDPVLLAGATLTYTGAVMPSDTSVSASGVTDARGRATLTVPVYVGPVGVLSGSVTGSGLSPLTLPAMPIRAGAANHLALVVPPAAFAVSGSALPTQPVLAIVDTADNQIAGAGVRVGATVRAAGVVVSNDSAVTGADGRATFTALTLQGSAGWLSIEFGSASLRGAQSGPIKLQAGAPTRLVSLTAGTTTPAGTAVPLSVRALDGSGNPVAGRTIRWSALSGGGSVTDSSQTDASGVAQASWRTGYLIGVQRLQAQDAPAGISVVMADTATVPHDAQLVMVQQPAGVSSGDTMNPSPSVQLRDETGRHDILLSGVPVKVSVDDSAEVGGEITVKTDANGLAQFAALTVTGIRGRHRLRFSAPEYESVESEEFEIASGKATKLSVVSGKLGAERDKPLGPITVQMTDSRGNPVNAAGTVTVSLLGGDAEAELGGKLSLPLSGGSARFDGLKVNREGTNYRLRFTTDQGLVGETGTFAIDKKK